MTRTASSLLLALLLCDCRRHRATHGTRETKLAPGTVVHVPRAAGPLAIDGELGEKAWVASGRSGAFLTAGKEARPYSDARFLWTNDTLYVGLYAADEDIEAKVAQTDQPLWVEDAFHLVFGDGPFETLDVSPLGTMTDARGPRLDALDYRWSMAAKAAVDEDGTPNDPSDDDEEWVVELAIPLASLNVKPVPGAVVPLVVQRCDRPKQKPRTCGALRLSLVLDG